MKDTLTPPLKINAQVMKVVQDSGTLNPNMSFDVLKSNQRVSALHVGKLQTDKGNKQGLEATGNPGYLIYKHYIVWNPE
jgi:hypothetical protein